MEDNEARPRRQRRGLALFPKGDVTSGQQSRGDPLYLFHLSYS